MMPANRIAHLLDAPPEPCRRCVALESMLRREKDESRRLGHMLAWAVVAAAALAPLAAVGLWIMVAG